MSPAPALTSYVTVNHHHHHPSSSSFTSFTNSNSGMIASSSSNHHTGSSSSRHANGVGGSSGGGGGGARGRRAGGGGRDHHHHHGGASGGGGRGAGGEADKEKERERLEREREKEEVDRLEELLEGEEMDCPLCMEEMDMSELTFRPCPCGYQICRFCWHNIKENLDGRCPNCRRNYDDEAVEFKPMKPEDMKRLQAAKKKREKQKKELEALNRKNLANVRVRQKCQVHIQGLTGRVANEDTVPYLKSTEQFGQYGKITKLFTSKRNSTKEDPTPTPLFGSTSAAANLRNQQVHVYINFSRASDAQACINAVDSTITPEGHRLKATWGTTKYCPTFLRGGRCTNENCMQAHELGEEVPGTGGEVSGGDRQEMSSMKHAAMAGGSRRDRERDREREAAGLPPTASWASNVKNSSSQPPTPTVASAVAPIGSSQPGGKPSGRAPTIATKSSQTHPLPPRPVSRAGGRGKGRDPERKASGSSKPPGLGTPTSPHIQLRPEPSSPVPISKAGAQPTAPESASPVEVQEATPEPTTSNEPSATAPPTEPHPVINEPVPEPVDTVAASPPQVNGNLTTAAPSNSGPTMSLFPENFAPSPSPLSALQSLPSFPELNFGDGSFAFSLDVEAKDLKGKGKAPEAEASPQEEIAPPLPPREEPPNYFGSFDPFADTSLVTKPLALTGNNENSRTSTPRSDGTGLMDDPMPRSSRFGFARKAASARPDSAEGFGSGSSSPFSAAQAGRSPLVSPGIPQFPPGMATYRIPAVQPSAGFAPLPPPTPSNEQESDTSMGDASALWHGVNINSVGTNNISPALAKTLNLPQQPQHQQQQHQQQQHQQQQHPANMFGGDGQQTQGRVGSPFNQNQMNGMMNQAGSPGLPPGISLQNNMQSPIQNNVNRSQFQVQQDLAAMLSRISRQSPGGQRSKPLNADNLFQDPAIMHASGVSNAPRQLAPMNGFNANNPGSAAFHQLDPTASAGFGFNRGFPSMIDSSAQQLGPNFGFPTSMPARSAPQAAFYPSFRPQDELSESNEVENESKFPISNSPPSASASNSYLQPPINLVPSNIPDATESESVIPDATLALSDEEEFPSLSVSANHSRKGSSISSYPAFFPHSLASKLMGSQAPSRRGSTSSSLRVVTTSQTDLTTENTSPARQSSTSKDQNSAGIESVPRTRASSTKPTPSPSPSPAPSASGVSVKSQPSNARGTRKITGKETKKKEVPLSESPRDSPQESKEQEPIMSRKPPKRRTQTQKHPSMAVTPDPSVASLDGQDQASVEQAPESVPLSAPIDAKVSGSNGDDVNAKVKTLTNIADELGLDLENLAFFKPPVGFDSFGSFYRPSSREDGSFYSSPPPPRLDSSAEFATLRSRSQTKGKNTLPPITDGDALSMEGLDSLAESLTMISHSVKQILIGEADNARLFAERGQSEVQGGDSNLATSATIASGSSSQPHPSRRRTTNERQSWDANDDGDADGSPKPGEDWMDSLIDRLQTFVGGMTEVVKVTSPGFGDANYSTTTTTEEKPSASAENIADLERAFQESTKDAVTVGFKLAQAAQKNKKLLGKRRAGGGGGGGNGVGQQRITTT